MLSCRLAQGGNFHLKVGGGAKAVAMLVTLCWGLQSVVDPGFTKGGGGGGGHKIMDACCLYDHTFI